ncbi:GTP-binding protein ryH1, putative [Entamoeba invadens IP1]|uniref:GTP-binding protein ryH1, putative n=1 Tax=Entamoeba invadens IP1 TaxID=370355 RepID=A0A0A1TZJ3_ENTIV|nr:GTP-binding protein ryH1, putative [Entamoeba invadens IP1]ELP85595.1 GTP-binding protein ryH1, putative [Entamoeba invadens IP1]|eukprot:XP_004184941.1 GTP-binding protein ryH1, putative [Entamoeba invadens IP1]
MAEKKGYQKIVLYSSMEDIARFKIAVVGDCSVGKTCIIGRFTSKNFDMSYDATIGTDFVTQLMEVDSKKIELQIWDTAGQERYRSLIPNYIRGSSVVLIVYDVNDRQSFNNVDSWINEVPEKDSTLVYLVANKIDSDQRNVTKEEGMKKSYQLSSRFIETSALKDIGIADLFEDIATNLAPLKPKINEDSLSIDETTGKGCC